MQKKKAIVALIAVLGIIAGIAAIVFQIKSRPQALPDRVSIGVSFDPLSAPVFIAQQKGFFMDEGLDATLLMHTTGKAALASMEKKAVHFATVADTVLMFAALDNKNIFAIATIADSSRHHRVLGLKSRGIAGVQDLRGRKIGVPAGTSGEFFLYSILLFNGISHNSITMVDLAPEKMARALENGDVDAVAAWPPTMNLLIEKFGNDAMVLDEDGYLMTWNMVAPAESMRDNPAVISKVLVAISRAEQYMSAHPDEAIALTAAACRLDPAALKRDWNNYRFNLRLGEGLLINLEDQARWAMKMYYRDRKLIPDFNEYIYAEGLRRIDPHAVAIRGRVSP